jgi:hypothetical protein
MTTFFPYSDKMAVVLDDRDDVWSESFPGLVQVAPFNFFSCFAEGISDTNLPRISEVLKEVHEKFFTENSEHVMITICELKQCVLTGCYILFDGIWRQGDDARIRETVQKTEEYGGTAVLEFVPYVTHVVTKGKSKAVSDAMEYDGIRIVNHLWFLHSCLRYCRADENDEMYWIPDVPNLTVGKLKRTEPPQESEISTGDLDGMFDSSAEYSDEDDGGSPVDLSFLDDDSDD